MRAEGYFSLEAILSLLLVAGVLLSAHNDLADFRAPLLARVHDLLVVWSYGTTSEEKMVSDASFFLGGNYSLEVNGKLLKEFSKGQPSGFVISDNIKIKGFFGDQLVRLWAG